MTDQTERRKELTELILHDVRGLWEHHDQKRILTHQEAASIVSGACIHFREWQKGIGEPFGVHDIMNTTTALLTLLREVLLERERGVHVVPVTRDSVTNNDFFGLRKWADGHDDQELVDRIDRYLRERREEDLEIILNKLATQRYEEAVARAGRG